MNYKIERERERFSQCHSKILGRRVECKKKEWKSPLLRGGRVKASKWGREGRVWVVFQSVDFFVEGSTSSLMGLLSRACQMCGREGFNSVICKQFSSVLAFSSLFGWFAGVLKLSISPYQHRVSVKDTFSKSCDRNSMHNQGNRGMLQKVKGKWIEKRKRKKGNFALMLTWQVFDFL